MYSIMAESMESYCSGFVLLLFVSKDSKGELQNFSVYLEILIFNASTQ